MKRLGFLLCFSLLSIVVFAQKTDDDLLQECFRKYDQASLSFRDHSLFLKDRKRYSKLFTYKKDDYKSWAYGLRSAGYATDKKYSEKLIEIIEVK